MLKGIFIYSFKCQLDDKYLDCIHLGNRIGLYGIAIRFNVSNVLKCASNHVRRKDSENPNPVLDSRDEHKDTPDTRSGTRTPSF